MSDLTPWQKLFAAIGGREMLASMLDVNETTVWRWTRGAVTPNSATRRAVNALCKEHKTPLVFEGK